MLPNLDDVLQEVCGQLQRRGNPEVLRYTVVSLNNRGYAISCIKPHFQGVYSLVHACYDTRKRERNGKP